MKAMRTVFSVFLVLIGALPAAAQTGTDMVEVDPITCWWRTSTSAVRTGESFNLRLTCSVVETEATKVVPDFTKLDATVVQLPPFEVLGGTHAGDLTVPGKRFFQYDYRLRLIAEDAFGGDVPIPPLEITYRIESQVSGGDTVQGRDLSYALPRASVRLISTVPDDTTDIREAPASAFTRIEDRESRANLLQTVAGVLFGLAGVIAVTMLIGMLRKQTRATATAHAHLAPRRVLAAAARELDEVQRASRRSSWGARSRRSALRAPTPLASRSDSGRPAPSRRSRESCSPPVHWAV
jgi:hypothetical protein